jgi:uncharacterized ferritin-like protein (DUF455 family)
VNAPPPQTVERWAWDYVCSTTLEAKLDADAVPGARVAEAAWEESPPPRRIATPGRPAELRVVARAEKSRALSTARGRAQALHAFFHHELQAAELMAWALLAFPDAPRELRAGLVRIAHDEIRHMTMYAREIERLGHRVGDFTVRDWFWQRVPTCADPASFMALMGLGLESANLEHAATFGARFRAHGDEESARVQEIVGLEEIAHVRFGVRWFQHYRGELTFDAWKRALPAPLTPLLMRGLPLRRDARSRAGQPASFLDALESWTPQ